jgi:hypothetical protein
MAGRLPNFLVVGAMKAGTTSLALSLAAHPDVYVPSEKEAHFFERDERWRRGVEWYSELFAGADGQRAIGEGTASYMFFTDVPSRMAAVVPDAKLIAILRDPVERAHSHYLHARTRAAERRTFAQIVEQEMRSDRHRPLPTSRQASGRSHYLARGLYLQQLEKLCEHYDRDSLLVLLLDDLESQPDRTFRKVCRFLDVDDTIVPDTVGARANSYFEPRSQRLWELALHLRLERWLPERARGGVARALVRLQASPPRMSPDVREQLSEYFAAPNAALAEWLGRDLSHWSAPRTA